LTGLPVLHNPRMELTLLYESILRFITALPEDYVYRKTTESLVKERQKIVKENENLDVIEEKINQGQLGELVIQAQNELSLIELLAQEKPWDNLMEKAPPDQWTWPPYK
ncbi:putative NADH dehydrogenase [ubiquinone] 1 alpha subcomplex subunit 5, partial [Eufriesea mexicana]